MSALFTTSEYTYIVPIMYKLLREYFYFFFFISFKTFIVNLLVMITRNDINGFCESMAIILYIKKNKLLQKKKYILF